MNGMNARSKGRVEGVRASSRITGKRRFIAEDMRSKVIFMTQANRLGFFTNKLAKAVVSSKYKDGVIVLKDLRSLFLKLKLSAGKKKFNELRALAGKGPFIPVDELVSIVSIGFISKVTWPSVTRGTIGQQIHE